MKWPVWFLFFSVCAVCVLHPFKVSSNTYTKLLLSIDASQCLLWCRHTLVGTDRLMLESKWIWGHFKWLVLSPPTLKGWAMPFTLLLVCYLWFIKLLTGKKGNLCQKLGSNYTWHVNNQERRQSRKLAIKKDRGEDQEWHKMSFTFSLYPFLYCLALAAVLLPQLVNI